MLDKAREIIGAARSFLKTPIEMPHRCPTRQQLQSRLATRRKAWLLSFGSSVILNGSFACLNANAVNKNQLEDGYFSKYVSIMKLSCSFFPQVTTLGYVLAPIITSATMTMKSTNMSKPIP